MSVKIASITASGARQPDATRFAADTIEVADVEFGMTIAQQDGRVTYKAPRITLKDYSGPASWQQQPASSSIIDIYRSVIEQFVRTNASSVTIPTIAGSMNFGGAGPGSGEFNYSGLSLLDIRDGKIGAMTAEAFTFTVNSQQAGKAEKLTGDLANFKAYDFDAAAAAAALDPQKASDDRSYRVYRQISTGPYTITAAPEVRMRIDGFTIDDVAMRPSRLQLPALLAVMPPSGDRANPGTNTGVHRQGCEGL